MAKEKRFEKVYTQGMAVFKIRYGYKESTCSLL